MTTALLSSIVSSAGLVTGVIVFAVALARGLVTKADLVTPETYQSETVKTHPIRPGGFEPDLAWPYHPFRQARADLAAVWQALATRYRALWRWPADAFFRGRHGSRFLWWLFFPIPLTVLGWLLSATVAGTFCYGVYAAVCALIMAVGGGFASLATVIARGAEGARHWRLRADASCPHCFHVTPWPAYLCPNPSCSGRHRDIRPGRLGLIMRRCVCGTRLPTMPWRAAWRLKAVCQRCGETLPRGAGALRDIRIVIFGDTSAGKTRFLFASLNSLLTGSGQDPVPVQFPDQISQEQIGPGLDLIRDGRETIQTPQARPAALTVRLGQHHRGSLVHLYDAAGEDYQDAQMHDALGFLHNGQDFAYILDPFSIKWVRDRLTGQVPDRIRMAANDPENAYDQVVRRLRDSGARGSGQRLAVIISKTDLLRERGLDVPTDSAAIADWLTNAGVHNLVLSAPREFAEVRYFTVASQPVHGQDDPCMPLRWLLRSPGTPFPADAARTATRAWAIVPETAEVRP